MILYKHVGKRVLINARGDLIVRPSYVEYALRRTPGGSVKEHYLTSYQRAMVAVVSLFVFPPPLFSLFSFVFPWQLDLPPREVLAGACLPQRF